MVEPAGEVAGDTFDFSLERDTLHLSMTDAMGHSMDAAILATVLVGALRNARPRRRARRAGAAGQRGADRPRRSGGFVTGQIARVDLRGGIATIINAGHPPPIRIRRGVAEPVDLLADPPFGAAAGQEFRVKSLSLQPGDRLFFFTDGMLERNAARLDLQALIVASKGFHPREAVQHLVEGLLDATRGNLADDAATMCSSGTAERPAGGPLDSGANDD